MMSFSSIMDVALHESCEEIRETRGQSVDALFRRVFKCWEN